MPEELDLPEIENTEEDVDHHVEKLETLMVSTETALQTLRGLQERLTKTNEVDRSVAKTIHMLTTGMESMDTHFSKYPTASYTALPGTTNLKVTMEGLASGIVTKMMEVINAIFNYIKEACKSLWKHATDKKKAREETMAKARPLLACTYHPLKDPTPWIRKGIPVRGGLGGVVKVIGPTDTPEKKAIEEERVIAEEAVVDALVPRCADRLNANPTVLYFGSGKGIKSNCGTAAYTKTLYEMEENAFVEIGTWLTTVHNKLENGKLTAAEILDDKIQYVHATRASQRITSMINCFNVNQDGDDIDVIIDGIDAAKAEKGTYEIKTSAEVDQWRVGFLEFMKTDTALKDLFVDRTKTLDVALNCKKMVEDLLKSPDCTPELSEAYRVTIANIRRCFKALNYITSFKIMYYNNVTYGLGVLSALPKSK